MKSLELKKLSNSELIIITGGRVDDCEISWIDLITR